MKNRRIKLVITLLIAISAISIIPSISSKPKKTIQIGVIASTTDSLNQLEPYFEEILELDINRYLEKLPRMRFTPQVKIEFILEDAQGDAGTHLEIVKRFHRRHVNIIIGGGWSSQAEASLDYINANDMVMVSASSTAPALAFADNFFRLCPADDNVQGGVLAQLIWSRDISNVIVLQRDDIYGNGLYDAFRTEYEGLGGSIKGYYPYPTNEGDFNGYLADANNDAEDVDDLGVLLISFNEYRDIIMEASSGEYSNIYNPPWFGPENIGRGDATLDEAPEQACYLKLYSSLPAPDYTSKYYEMEARFEELDVGSFGYYLATYADAAWLLTQAILETKPSMTKKVDATAIVSVFPDIASRYYGYSGWCQLNEYGDRVTLLYDIWGYYWDDGTPRFKRYGLYDVATAEIEWYD